MTADLPYRPNVGIALFNTQGRVFIAKRFKDDGPEIILPGLEWQMPQGGIDADEDPRPAAVRELYEETGYRAAEWARAGITHNAIAYATEGIEIWFARGLTLGERSLDAGEFLDVFEASVGSLEDAARGGEVTDAKTLIGLLWLGHWRAGRWPLQWVSAASPS